MLVDGRYVEIEHVRKERGDTIPITTIVIARCCYYLALPEIEPFGSAIIV